MQSLCTPYIHFPITTAAGTSTSDDDGTGTSTSTSTMLYQLVDDTAYYYCCTLVLFIWYKYRKHE